MTNPRTSTKRARRLRARRQEGGVILLVLMVVMMMAGLAGFAAQNGTYEVRAVGGTRQLSRLRRSSESFLVAVGSFLSERFVGGKGTVAVADQRWTSTATNESGLPVGNYRKLFNVPDWGGDASLMQVSRDEFGGVNYPLADGLIPNDRQLNAGVVTPFVFDGVTLIERYDLPALAGQGMGLNNGMQSGMRAYRVCATAYTRMRLDANIVTDTVRTGEYRGMHDSVVVARAYFELR